MTKTSHALILPSHESVNLYVRMWRLPIDRTPFFIMVNNGHV